MFTNNGVAKNSDKGKRKMTDFCWEMNPKETSGFDVGNSQHLDGRILQVQRILNNTAPLIKPLSYMSLLTAPDENEEEDNINSVFKDTKFKINQKISLYEGNLKQSLEGVLRDAEERAVKRMKKKQDDAEEEAEKRLKKKEEEVMELDKMVEHYKAKSERLETRVSGLERTKVSLRRRLREGARGRHLEIEEEEGESRFQDTGRVGPVILDCKVCRREIADVMLWPCRHVCVCKTCEVPIRYCPVCAHIKTTSIQLLLPLHN